MSARLQGTSSALYFIHPRHYVTTPSALHHTAMPPRLPSANAPPALRTTLLPHVHACSGPPALYSSIFPRLHACVTPLKLSPCHRAYRVLLGLYSSTPLCLYSSTSGHLRAYSLVARVQSSIPLCLQDTLKFFPHRFSSLNQV